MPKAKTSRRSTKDTLHEEREVASIWKNTTKRIGRKKAKQSAAVFSSTERQDARRLKKYDSSHPNSKTVPKSVSTPVNNLQTGIHERAENSIRKNVAIKKAKKRGLSKPAAQKKIVAGPKFTSK